MGMPKEASGTSGGTGKPPTESEGGQGAAEENDMYSFSAPKQALPAPKWTAPVGREMNSLDAAKLIKTSGVRDFVQFNSSGYNQPRKPGSGMMKKDDPNLR